jgi:hypothetical protein
LANTRKGNVVKVDTSAEFNEVLRIERVKVVNANAGSQTSTIKSGGSGGTIVYTKTLAASTEAVEDVPMRFTYGDQCYVTVGTDCTVYLYLES